MANRAGAGTAAAGGAHGNLHNLPSAPDPLDDFVRQLTPKPRDADQPQRKRLDEGIENPPTITWTTLPDPDVGIRATVPGKDGVLVAFQTVLDRVDELLGGNFDNKLRLELHRELQLELHSDVDIWTFTLQKRRDGHIPAWIIGGTGVPATHGDNDNNNPPTDPLDDFIDKLTSSDEPYGEGEDNDRMDESAFENHPPIVWEALPGDCIATLVEGWNNWVLAKQMFYDRVKERIGNFSCPVTIKILRAHHLEGDFWHVVMWINHEYDGPYGTWVQYGNGPCIPLNDEAESHQAA